MPDSLYIHIPFCTKKCIYCDFFSVPYEKSLAKSYVDALCKELCLKKDSIRTLKTVYIGGGTPSVLPDNSFRQLFECLRNNFHFSSDVEISVEANPGTVAKPKIDTLLSLAVNRISIGVQSFHDVELKTLERIHSSSEALKSIESIKKAGISNFSLDLIYGIPGQTIKSWKDSLSMAVELSPSHIAAYELTPEKRTPLYRLIQSGKIKMQDEEPILDMYNHAIDYLSSSGYKHYEISNFALPGFHCIHNLNYWNRGEYAGAGAGAHSFISGVRSKNINDIARYIECLNNRIIPEIESVKLTPLDAVKEFIFLGLRKREGINCFRRNDTVELLEASKELINEGYMEIGDEHLRLTRKGIVVSNSVIVRLFEKVGL